MQDLDQLDRTQAVADLLKDSFSRFIRHFWPHVDPAPYKHGWHIDLMAEYLEAMARGEIRKLLINVPPGCQKSLTVSVFWPAWVWTRNPEKRFMATAYGEILALRDADKSRELMKSAEYQKLFGNVFSLRSGQNTKGRYENSRKGYRYSSSVEGIMGEGGDFVILDDPHNVKIAESDAVREEMVRKLNLAVPSRVRSLKGGLIVIMQRLHESDYSGAMLSEGGVVHLCLPNRFETDHPNRSRPVKLPNGRLLGGDQRKAEGELLFPGLWPQHRLEPLETTLGPYGVAGQLQQRPAPKSGGMFDPEWWEYCAAIDVPQNGRVVRGWDLAGTEAKKAKAIKASYTAGVRMRRVGSKYYIEHVKRFQASSFKVEQEMMRLAEADGRDVSIDIPQDPGQAGKSQKAYLGGKFPGFNVRFSPESGEKETRALGLSAQAEAGNVFLVRGPWNKPFIDEAAMFPNSTFKDQIDAASRAFNRLIVRQRRVESEPVMELYR